jgi:TatD DNase family protein
MHCFSGDAAFVGQCAKRAFLPSFAGTVAFSNAGTLREAAVATPLDSILVQTGALFLIPMPYRGRPNGSCLIALTGRDLAEVTGSDLITLCAAISANGVRVFGPWR